MKQKQNDIQIFNNEKLNLKVRTIQNEDGSININVEDTAIGLGIVKKDKKNGKEYIRPHMQNINKWLSDLGSPKISKNDYISESIFYMLGMKASNKVARKFQQWIAVDVIPSIRKHGGYLTPQKIEEVLLNPDTIIKLATELKAEREKTKQLTQEKKVLSIKNDLLSEEVLKWADRNLINAIIRKYGSSLGNQFGVAWIEFKKEILYKHSINLNARITHYLNKTGKKTKPKTLEMLHDEELSKAISTAVALCHTNNVNISDIIEKFCDQHHINKSK